LPCMPFLLDFQEPPEIHCKPEPVKSSIKTI
jgi:hypothetical protein